MTLRASTVARPIGTSQGGLTGPALQNQPQQKLWTNKHLSPLHLHDISNHNTVFLRHNREREREKESETVTATFNYTHTNRKLYHGRQEHSGRCRIYTSLSNHIDHSFQQGFGPTIFQTELYAISSLSDFLLDNPIYISPEINICTDS